MIRLTALAMLLLVCPASFADDLCEPERIAYAQAYLDYEAAEETADAAYDSWMLDPSNPTLALAYANALEALGDADDAANDAYEAWQMCLNLVRLPQKSAAQMIEAAPSRSILVH